MKNLNYRNVNVVININQGTNPRLGKDGATCYDYECSIKYSSDSESLSAIDGKIENFTYISFSQEQAYNNVVSMAESLINQFLKYKNFRFYHYIINN